MNTITTIEELETLLESGSDLFVRWSNGPEADAANGWISKNYAGTWDEVRGDYDYIPVEEVGLSATPLNGTNAITRWAGEVHGEICYILTGREITTCSDGEPLIDCCQPLGIVSPALIASL